MNNITPEIEKKLNEAFDAYAHLNNLFFHDQPIRTEKEVGTAKSSWMNAATEILNNPSIYLPDYILRSEALVWVKASERLPVKDNPRSLKNVIKREYDTKDLIPGIHKYFSDGIELPMNNGKFGRTILFTNIEWLSTPSSNEVAGMKEENENLRSALKTCYEALKDLVRQLPVDENLADYRLDFAEAAEQKALAALNNK